MQYIIMSKSQTDNLEAIFGLYRQLNGSIILAYVQEIIRSDGKLKARELLRLFTSTKGVVSVKDFLCTFNEKDQQDTTFIYAFSYCDMYCFLINVCKTI